MLEAFRIFGLELLGIDMVFLVNDSLFGPLDMSLSKKVKAVQGAKMISTGVWKNAVATGAGVAFTRQMMDKPGFINYWRWVRRHDG